MGAACSPVDSAAPAADAGATYARAFSAEYTGALGTLNVRCDGEDALISGACVANDGTVTASAPAGANGWHCEAAPDVPAKGEDLIGWIECRGSGNRDGG